jgi:hypothetical protein
MPDASPPSISPCALTLTPSARLRPSINTPTPLPSSPFAPPRIHLLATAEFLNDARRYRWAPRQFRRFQVALTPAAGTSPLNSHARILLTSLLHLIRRESSARPDPKHTCAPRLSNRLPPLCLDANLGANQTGEFASMPWSPS